MDEKRKNLERRLEDIKYLKHEYLVGTKEALEVTRRMDRYEEHRATITQKLRSSGVNYLPTANECGNMVNLVEGSFTNSIIGYLAHDAGISDEETLGEIERKVYTPITKDLERSKKTIEMAVDFFKIISQGKDRISGLREIITYHIVDYVRSLFGENEEERIREYISSKSNEEFPGMRDIENESLQKKPTVYINSPKRFSRLKEEGMLKRLEVERKLLLSDLEECKNDVKELTETNKGIMSVIGPVESLMYILQAVKKNKAWLKRVLGN